MNDDLRHWTQIKDRGAGIHSFLLDSMNPETMALSLRRLGRKSDAIAFFGVDHPDMRDEVNRGNDGAGIVRFPDEDPAGALSRPFLRANIFALARATNIMDCCRWEVPDGVETMRAMRDETNHEGLVVAAG